MDNRHFPTYSSRQHQRPSLQQYFSSNSGANVIATGKSATDLISLLNPPPMAFHSGSRVWLRFNLPPTGVQLGIYGLNPLLFPAFVPTCKMSGWLLMSAGKFSVKGATDGVLAGHAVFPQFPSQLEIFLNSLTDRPACLWLSCLQTEFQIFPNFIGARRNLNLERFGGAVDSRLNHAYNDCKPVGTACLNGNSSQRIPGSSPPQTAHLGKNFASRYHNPANDMAYHYYQCEPDYNKPFIEAWDGSPSKHSAFRPLRRRNSDGFGLSPMAPSKPSGLINLPGTKFNDKSPSDNNNDLLLSISLPMYCDNDVRSRHSRKSGRIRSTSAASHRHPVTDVRQVLEGSPVAPAPDSPSRYQSFSGRSVFNRSAKSLRNLTEIFSRNKTKMRLPLSNVNFQQEKTTPETPQSAKLTRKHLSVPKESWEKRSLTPSPGHKVFRFDANLTSPLSVNSDVSFTSDLGSPKEPQQMCAVCGFAVPTDRFSIKGTVYHRGCFKCIR